MLQSQRKHLPRASAGAGLLPALLLLLQASAPHMLSQRTQSLQTRQLVDNSLPSGAGPPPSELLPRRVSLKTSGCKESSRLQTTSSMLVDSGGKSMRIPTDLWLLHPVTPLDLGFCSKTRAVVW